MSRPSSPSSAPPSGSSASTSSDAGSDAPSRSNSQSQSLQLHGTPTHVVKAVGKEVKFVSYDQTLGYTIKGRMTLPNVGQRAIMDILTDWSACSSVFKNIEKCSVETLPSGNKKVMQTCRWRFMWLSGCFDCAYQVKEERNTPAPGQGRLEFDLIESSFMRSFRGLWDIRPAPAPAADDNAPGSETQGTYMEHVMCIKPSKMVPRPFAKFARGLFVAQVQGILDDLEAEVIKRAAAGRLTSHSVGNSACNSFTSSHNHASKSNSFIGGAAPADSRGNSQRQLTTL